MATSVREDSRWSTSTTTARDPNKPRSKSKKDFNTILPVNLGTDNLDRLRESTKGLGIDAQRRQLYDYSLALADRDREIAKRNGTIGFLDADEDRKNRADRYFEAFQEGMPGEKITGNEMRGENGFTRFLGSPRVLLNTMNNAIGSGIDWGIDRFGDLAGVVTGNDDVRENIQNFTTGEDIAPWVSLAEDLGIMAVAPMTAPAILAGKGLAEHSDDFYEAMTGVDNVSGAELTDSQRGMKALSGGIGTALTALPGVSSAKAARKLAKDEVEKGINNLIRDRENMIVSDTQRMQDADALKQGWVDMQKAVSDAVKGTEGEIRGAAGRIGEAESKIADFEKEGFSIADDGTVLFKGKPLEEAQEALGKNLEKATEKLAQPYGDTGKTAEELLAELEALEGGTRQYAIYGPTGERFLLGGRDAPVRWIPESGFSNEEFELVPKALKKRGAKELTRKNADTEVAEVPMFFTGDQRMLTAEDYIRELAQTNGIKDPAKAMKAAEKEFNNLVGNGRITQRPGRYERTPGTEETYLVDANGSEILPGNFTLDEVIGLTPEEKSMLSQLRGMRTKQGKAQEAVDNIATRYSDYSASLAERKAAEEAKNQARKKMGGSIKRDEEGNIVSGFGKAKQGLSEGTLGIKVGDRTINPTNFMREQPKSQYEEWIDGTRTWNPYETGLTRHDIDQLPKLLGKESKKASRRIERSQKAIEDYKKQIEEAQKILDSRAMWNPFSGYGRWARDAAKAGRKDLRSLASGDMEAYALEPEIATDLFGTAAWGNRLARQGLARQIASAGGYGKAFKNILKGKPIGGGAAKKAAAAEAEDVAEAGAAEVAEEAAEKGSKGIPRFWKRGKKGAEEGAEDAMKITGPGGVAGIPLVWSGIIADAGADHPGGLKGAMEDISKAINEGDYRAMLPWIMATLPAGRRTPIAKRFAMATGGSTTPYMAMKGSLGMDATDRFLDNSLYTQEDEEDLANLLKAISSEGGVR